MNEADPAVPAAIESALRSIEAVAGCVSEGPPTFAASARRWFLPLTLRIGNAGAFVPAVTRWCVGIDQAYPSGSIEFFPAARDGITATFPHQERNEPEAHGHDWRRGKLCLDSPFRGERHRAAVRDPFGDAEARLRWHVQRALQWLDAAARGALLAPGDPFELPARPQISLEDEKYRRVVHDETASALTTWISHYRNTGVVRFGAVPGLDGAIAVARFEDWQGNTIREWTGRPIGTWTEELYGVWWLWPEPIVLPPWQCAVSWGELRTVGRNQGVDVDAALRQFATRTRGVKALPLMLVGYPIPRRVGEAPSEVHWDAIALPKLRAAGGTPPHGFRPNSLGWWQRDRTRAFGDDKKLAHVQTENWSQERLQARGRLPPALRDARVVILGIGALGATIAELMVRAGVRDICLVDRDLLAAGNICRHPATLSDVGNAKVKVMAARLQQISPFVNVTAVGGALPSDLQALVSLLEPYGVVVDCTASDDVSLLLSEAWWPLPKTFSSFSLGYGGRRLFALGVSGHQFPGAHLREALAPWLADEAAAWSADEEVLEGAGCWSPLFPARYDDVVIAAAMAMKELEHLVAERCADPRFRVFEQQRTPHGCDGFVLREAPPRSTGAA